MTKISWVKGHTEKGGAKTNDHGKQNSRTDADAEKAYAHEDSSVYREGYCSQFDTLKGAAIEGTVIAHKMPPAVLRHLQHTQYLDYWRSRAGAGAWFKNADFVGHAAACKRARKGNPQNCPVRNTRV